MYRWWSPRELEEHHLKITVFYVGASLLAPLRKAEADIRARQGIDFSLAAHNCGVALDLNQWRAAETDIAQSDIVFIIHVTDEENATRIAAALDQCRQRHHAVIAFNCMPVLMRRTRLGKLDFSRMLGGPSSRRDPHASTQNLLRRVSSWMSDYFKGRSGAPNSRKSGAHTGQYLKLIAKLPSILRLVPGSGKLGDIKHYLSLFCYFLQPTPNNIRSMLLYSIKHYVPGHDEIRGITRAEALPAVAAYHPDAPRLFRSFEAYRRWYKRARGRRLEPDSTIGLLLMRPQVVSDAHRHYDALIRAIEGEGLAVIPVLSTLMDNREASRVFFAEDGKPRLSQIVSLTGFSFVGGPAMNDSQAAVEFLNELNVPLRSMVSLDFQTVDNWQQSRLGLNPVQTAMQVAIPEIDGATEPLIFGGLPGLGDQPEPIEDRCHRIARRLARWNRLRTTPRHEQRLAFLIYCFPPNKGNIGTAADLDVFPSLLEILKRLAAVGYCCELPESGDQLRHLLLEGNSSGYGTVANVAYRMTVDEYLRLCPYVDQIEREWGRAPGSINSDGRNILIQGVQLGNVFIGLQPTFGYEGDPMRMLNAESGAPHHGFMALYTYLDKVFGADAVVHVGTHGAMEFMPGKQVGLSETCWPDRLIGELPNIYIYSVNNPSEGTIAKRRSYAELISYLTPPIESAGLYKELLAMKELVGAYRKATSETERAQLFEAIEEKARELNL